MIKSSPDKYYSLILWVIFLMGSFFPSAWAESIRFFLANGDELSIEVYSHQEALTTISKFEMPSQVLGLDLYDVPISNKEQTSLSKRAAELFPGLTSLSLPMIDRRDFEYLSRLRRLKKLKFRVSVLEVPTAELLETLPDLESLELNIIKNAGNCSWSEALFGSGSYQTFKALSQMRHLRTLSLSNFDETESFSTNCLALLKDLSNLEYFKLWDVSVLSSTYELDLGPITNMASLSKLEISLNLKSLDQLKRLNTLKTLSELTLHIPFDLQPKSTYHDITKALAMLKSPTLKRTYLDIQDRYFQVMELFARDGEAWAQKGLEKVSVQRAYVLLSHLHSASAPYTQEIEAQFKAISPFLDTLPFEEILYFRLKVLTHPSTLGWKEIQAQFDQVLNRKLKGTLISTLLELLTQFDSYKNPFNRSERIALQQDLLWRIRTLIPHYFDDHYCLSPYYTNYYYISSILDFMQLDEILSSMDPPVYQEDKALIHNFLEKQIEYALSEKSISLDSVYEYIQKMNNIEAREKWWKFYLIQLQAHS